MKKVHSPKKSVQKIISNDVFLLRIYVVPGSTRNEVVGAYGDPARLKIKISAPPEDGKANKMLIKFLSEIYFFKRQNIEILRGETSQKKDILIKEKIEDLFLQRFIQPFHV